MREYIKYGIRRLLGAGGYAIVGTQTLVDLQQTLVDLQQTRVDLQQTRVDLQRTAEDIKNKIDALRRQQDNIWADGFSDRLRAAADACIEQLKADETLGDREAIAEYYLQAVSNVNRLWLREGGFPLDPYPDDDLTFEYAFNHNIYVPGQGNEVEVSVHKPVSWRHLTRDRNCGIFLIVGQSNAANHSNSPYSSQRAVYNFDFLRMLCTQACDPLPGASGLGGSVWSRLGDILIERKMFRRVIFVPVAFGGSFIADWLPGGSKHGRVALALSRLRKELCLSMLPFSAVLWQQGEAEANHTQMSSLAYQKSFYELATELRRYGVFAPVFVALTTFCQAEGNPFRNHEAIREAQKNIPDTTKAIFPGPDTDLIGPEERFDGCHFSGEGAQHCAELWYDALCRRQSILEQFR
jgi:hypothetical protein